MEKTEALATDDLTTMDPDLDEEVDQSQLVLGSISWQYVHGYKEAKEWSDGVISTTTQKANDILRSGHVTRDEILRLGRMAQARGTCADGSQHIPIFEYGGASIRLLPAVTSTWYKVDGVIPQTDMDTANRLQRGPLWDSCSCAVDSTLVVALLLNAGRVQVDQGSEEYVRGLGIPARLVRGIVRLPWSRVTAEHTSKVRDILRAALEEEDAIKFPRRVYVSIPGIVEQLYYAPVLGNLLARFII